ncbi:MAG: CoA transferase [Firmicutes bacterium]|nr:CoA transferase [Bacillota bacterium]
MSGSAGPLAGIRVLELGSLIAGPFAGRLLADMGAEVVKVEAPDTPDPMRQWGQATYRGRRLWWTVQSRNKYCITLNLRLPEGQALFRRLAQQADVVIENFRPGTLEQWQLGWDELSAVNPRLILVRVSGFGQTGPYRDRAGFGAVAEAMGGLRYVTGFPDRPPVRLGISLGDAVAALYATIGTLAALQERHRSGRGQVVDVSITEAVFSLMESAVPDYGRTGHVRERSGNILPGIAPSNVYPTRDGQYLVIGANQDRVFRRLCEVLGHPEVAEDPRFATHEARGQHQEALDDLIAQWTRQWDQKALAERLHQAGIPAGPIYSIADIMQDPHFLAREMIVPMEDPELGLVEVPGPVPKFSRTDSRLRWTGPAHPGEHNQEVYQRWLGLEPSALEALHRQGVV